MAFAWRERMHVSWAAGAGERAVADSQSVLDAIEALRDLQAATPGKAEAFSTWSEDYYWLSGRLIEAAQAGGGPENLDRAFGVAERLRARSLIDTLEAAHAVPAAAVPIQQRRGAVLERISGVQRQLLSPDLPAAERTRAMRELETLEIQETDLRNQLAHAAPALASPRRPDFATLSRVRRTLDPGEALLSFQIAPWEGRTGRLRRRLVAAGDDPRRHPRLPSPRPRRPGHRRAPLQRHVRAARRLGDGTSREPLPAAPRKTAGRAAAGDPPAADRGGRRPPSAAVRGAAGHRESAAARRPLRADRDPLGDAVAGLEGRPAARGPDPRPGARRSAASRWQKPAGGRRDRAGRHLRFRGPAGRAPLRPARERFRGGRDGRRQHPAPGRGRLRGVLKSAPLQRFGSFTSPPTR